FYIFWKRNIVAGLKIHVVLLALTYLQSCFAKKFREFLKHHGAVTFKKLIGQNQHSITRKYRGVHIPFFMDSFFPPSQGSIVHNIIVYERKIMEQFYGQRSVDGLVEIRPKKITHHHYERRANSFSTQ